MQNLVNNIDSLTNQNNFFRKVILTTSNQQLVLMHLNPSEDIGMETHNHLDQFIKVESGEGIAILNGQKFTFSEGYSITIPAGTEHNIINSSQENPIKLYTVYSPPNHKDGTIHKTKQEAIENEEHFEG
jgi:mannose-6-phosphate isomerase-like protein (cupin superfamily)